MTTPTDAPEPRRTISFWRRGAEPFDGKLYLRGARFEDFLLQPINGRIPQDACDAIKAAIARLESGAPDAYEQAVAALSRVSSGIGASWS